LAAFAAIAFAGSAQAQDLEAGRELFERLQCGRCHGAQAGGDFGPQLAGIDRSLEVMISQLRNPRGGMPAFGPNRVSEEEAAAIHAWLQSLPAEPSYPTWFSSDLINLPTPQMPGRQTLEVHFTHRFTESVMDAGREGLWGLDSFAVPAFWFAYGVVDRLQVHGGRSSNRGTWEYGAKVELLEEGRIGVPVAASVVLSGAYLDRDAVVDKNRFTAELPVGWRAHERVSLLLTPLFATNTDANADPASDGYSAALGLGAAFRISHRQSIDVEWVTNIGGFEFPDAVDQWQVFWGMKVGGHVFQLGVTNGIGYTADQMAPGTLELGRESDVRIGFNLVREFKFGGG
jgi:cytochrome c553